MKPVFKQFIIFISSIAIIIWILIAYTFIKPLVSKPTQEPEPAPSTTDQDQNPSNLDLPPNGINLTISPPIINLKTAPLATASSEFKVKNNNNFPEQLAFSLVKLDLSQSRPTLSQVETADPFPGWIQFSPSSVQIQPNQTQKIKLTLNPPETATLGYYYAILINRQQNIISSDQPANLIGGSAIWLFTEIDNPNTKRELSLISFSPTQNWYELLPATFNYQVKNTGNIHLTPFGDIIIKNAFNPSETITTLPVNSSGSLVLPDSEKTFTSSWHQSFLSLTPTIQNNQVVHNKDGSIKQHIQFNLDQSDKIYIGKYTAELILIYDDGEKDIPLTLSTSFWIFPWKIITAATLILYIFLRGLLALIPINKK